MPSVFDLEFHRGGVFLPRLGLWLDAHHRVTGPELAFVSHAHSDHTGSHREVVLTAATARLMRARGARPGRENVLQFGERRAFDAGGLRFTLTLLPAGHILGSAMAFVEAGGESLLYTGDFKLRAGLAAETCLPQRADWLVMESTFGRPQYRMPPAAEVRSVLLRFCGDALARGATPVLLAYSLGKTQELLRLLEGADLRVTLHEAAWEMTRIYEEFGHRFAPYDRHASGSLPTGVVICSAMSGTKARARHAGAVRTAVITGWAIDSSCRFRHGTDAAFPLSDHADFPELIEMARKVAPKKVYTLHGFAADLAHSLREAGFDAQALSEPEQFQFTFNLATNLQSSGREISQNAECSEWPASAHASMRSPR